MHVSKPSWVKTWHLMKMLLEALSAIDAAHVSVVIHGLLSAPWSCTPPERKLWALLPRRTSWNSRKQFVAHIPSLQRQGMLWPTQGTDSLRVSTTFKIYFKVPISGFTFGIVSIGSATVCCVVRLERRSIHFGHLLPLPSPITRRQLPLSRRVCPACSTVIKTHRRDALFKTWKRSTFTSTIFSTCSI